MKQVLYVDGGFHIKAWFFAEGNVLASPVTHA